MGSQLIWMYGKVVSVWSRQRTSSSSSLSQLHKKVQQAGKKTSSSSTSTSSQQDKASLSKADETAREGLFHLEKAAELGHSEAQRMVANSLASGILPLSDHSLMHRLAEWQFDQSSKDGSNWTSILLQFPDSLVFPLSVGKLIFRLMISETNDIRARIAINLSRLTVLPNSL